MKILLGILALFSFSFSFAQEGDWRWSSADERHQFELTISKIQDGKGVEGQHCAVFNEGNKIDCSTQANEISFQLKEIGENVFRGIITSYYGNGVGEVKLIYNPEKETLRFLLLKKPEGIFYLPEDVVLLR